METALSEMTETVAQAGTSDETTTNDAAMTSPATEPQDTTEASAGQQ